MENIIELIENEKNLLSYEIDDIKYFDNENKIFEKIGNKKNIFFEDKLILQFHIKKPKNIFLNNLKWKKNYYNNELKKIYKKYINYSYTNKKYDLIYLYASPIIKDNNYSESESPISYMEEIQIIYELMKMQYKKFNCKFECIGKMF